MPAITVLRKFVRIAATCLSPTHDFPIHFAECTINIPKFNFEPLRRIFEGPFHEF